MSPHLPTPPPHTPLSSTSPPSPSHEPAHIQSLIDSLSMTPHPEGGYFVELDRDPLRVPNPFRPGGGNGHSTTDDDATRNASTTILYLLTPRSGTGRWHTNKARTVHSLVWGRGRYALLHPGEDADGKARVECFTVGADVRKGERVVWIVEGDRWKASWLLPEDEGGEERGLLVCETVVPGFEYKDHAFLDRKGLEELLPPEKVEEWKWLLREEK